MAVQDIVLGGFGSTGSVSLIVTHGFESYVGEPSSEWQEDVQNIVLGGFGNLGSVSLIVTSGFYSEQVVLEEIIRGGGGGGGRYRHYTEYYHKPRKFGKKDEEELKRLLLKAAEEDRKAQKTLEKKAEDLQEVIGGIACIENAVAAAASEVRNMAASDEISWKKAKLILEELYEEEEILLAIVMNI